MDVSCCWPAAGLGDVVLWDVAEKKPKPSLPGPAGDISAIAFSPDGRTLVLGYFRFPGYFVRLLQVPSLEEIDAAETSAITKGIR